MLQSSGNDISTLWRTPTTVNAEGVACNVAAEAGRARQGEVNAAPNTEGAPPFRADVPVVRIAKATAMLAVAWLSSSCLDSLGKASWMPELARIDMPEQQFRI